MRSGDLRLVNRYKKSMKARSAICGGQRQVCLRPRSTVAAALLGELRGRSKEVLVQRQKENEG